MPRRLAVEPALMKVFITGASSGLGLALARQYARQGATLGLTGRRMDALALLAAELGVHASLYALDVRDAPGMTGAAAAFMAEHGLPDLVIASAGISVGTITGEAQDAAAMDAVMQTNVMGVVHTFMPFVKPMCAARRGTLVGISSVASVRGLPGAGAYSASKAALNTYLESLRVELRGSGVAVVAVLPGYIATPMTAGNPYAMPFMLSAPDAALRIARAIARKPSRVVIPWQMGLVARGLAILPDWLYDWLFARAPRKPRQPE